MYSTADATNYVIRLFVSLLMPMRTTQLRNQFMYVLGTMWQDFDLRISENYHGKFFVVLCGNCRGMMASQAVISLGYRQMVFEVQWILFSRFPQDRDCACWKLCLNIRGKGYPVLSFVAFRIACPLSILRHPTNDEFIMKHDPIIHL